MPAMAVEAKKMLKAAEMFGRYEENAYFCQQKAKELLIFLFTH
jgi:hypothetical protein